MANGLPGFSGTDDFRREQQDAQEAYLRGTRGAATAQQQAMMAANPKYMSFLRRQAVPAMAAFRYSPEWATALEAGKEWGSEGKIGEGRMGAFQDWVGAGGLSNLDDIRERMRTAASTRAGTAGWDPERWEQLRQFERFRPYEDRYTQAAQLERDRAFELHQIGRPTTGFEEAQDYLGFQGWNPYVGQDIDPSAGDINVTGVDWTVEPKPGSGDIASLSSAVLAQQAGSPLTDAQRAIMISSGYQPQSDGSLREEGETWIDSITGQTRTLATTAAGADPSPVVQKVVTDLIQTSPDPARATFIANAMASANLGTVEMVQILSRVREGTVSPSMIRQYLEHLSMGWTHDEALFRALEGSAYFG